MVRIFAKIIKNHKTVKSVTYNNVNEYESSRFYFYLSETCRKLELSTPITVDYHRESFEKFNMVKFFPEDFVDGVDFDCFILENIDL